MIYNLSLPTLEENIEEVSLVCILLILLAQFETFIGLSSF